MKQKPFRNFVHPDIADIFEWPKDFNGEGNAQPKRGAEQFVEIDVLRMVIGPLNDERLARVSTTYSRGMLSKSKTDPLIWEFIRMDIDSAFENLLKFSA